MAGSKVANGAKPNPPKKRKRKTVPKTNPVKKQETQVASGAKPNPPKKRTRRG